MRPTCTEVNEDVEQENGVGADVEDDPARTEVVREERDGHGEDDEVGDEKHEHTHVPVKPTRRRRRPQWVSGRGTIL